jgi:hypothetical protein
MPETRYMLWIETSAGGRPKSVARPEGADDQIYLDAAVEAARHERRLLDAGFESGRRVVLSSLQVSTPEERAAALTGVQPVEQVAILESDAAIDPLCHPIRLEFSSPNNMLDNF